MPELPVISASRIVPAPAEAVFALLADPSRHPVLDGSGMIRGTLPRTPQRLSLGARFGMRMRWHLPYTITNEVVEFDEGRRIGWRHFGGHVWRFLLEPEGPGATRVTEQFDPTTSRAPVVLRVLGWDRRNRQAIEQTLDRLEHWAQEQQGADRAPNGS